MTEQTKVATKEAGAVKAAESQSETVVHVPDVDICEGADGLRLTANMPGVEQASVNVTVEDRVLTVEGRVCVDDPDGYRLVGQEFAAGRFRRGFTLSGDIDTDGVTGRIKHGVLEVALPKREEVKAKKIEITS